MRACMLFRRCCDWPRGRAGGDATCGNLRRWDGLVAEGLQGFELAGAHVTHHTADACYQ